MTQELALHGRDEVGQLGDALKQAVQKVRELLLAIRDGSQTMSSQSEEFSATMEELSATMQTIQQSTEQIAQGTEELSASTVGLVVAVPVQMPTRPLVRLLIDRNGSLVNKSFGLCRFNAEFDTLY